ncbi:hypothetical protein Dimus_033378, partial [Dionaea muscipula]
TTTATTSADEAAQVGFDEATAIANVDEVSEAVDEMSLVAKDVDTHTYAIQEKITKSIKANTDYLEATLKEAAEDTKTRFELIESKLKVIELDLNINFNMKIDKAEKNLAQQIGENSSRITNVEETLASLLKAQ